jgi:hypothetical protein
VFAYDTSETVEGKSVAPVVFICRQCKQAAVSPSSAWNEPKTGPSQRLPLHIRLGDLSDYPCRARFELLCSAGDEDGAQYPLCVVCAGAAIEHVNRLARLESEFATSIAEMAQRRNAQLPAVDRRATEPAVENVTQRATHTVYELGSETVPARPHHSISSGFGHLGVFHFDIVELFPTVNGLRLGTFKSSTVPVTEIQTALFFLCRFLFCQRSRAGLDATELRFGAGVEVSGVEMVWPRGKSREIGLFNFALAKLLELFDSFFNPSEGVACVPPNLIDVKAKCIGNQDWQISKDGDATSFTRAMRKLIVNVMTVQAFQTVFAA